MSFAKNYLKQYNAETAWDSLRGGSGAYEYSTAPRHTERLFRIRDEAQSLGDRAREIGDIYGQVENYLEALKDRQRQNVNVSMPTLEDVQGELKGIIGSAMAYPDYMSSQPLAGRYMY